MLNSLDRFVPAVILILAHVTWEELDHDWGG